MKIILGASGAGKSRFSGSFLDCSSPTAGRYSVNGQRVNQLSEVELMAVRSDVGMVFQEGALFDSLTVRENVGYRLLRRDPTAARKVNHGGRSPGLRGTQ